MPLFNRLIFADIDEKFTQLQTELEAVTKERKDGVAKDEVLCREASAIDQQLRTLNNERKEIAEADKVILEQFKAMGEEVEKIKV